MEQDQHQGQDGTGATRARGSMRRAKQKHHFALAQLLQKHLENSHLHIQRVSGEDKSRTSTSPGHSHLDRLEGSWAEQCFAFSGWLSLQPRAECKPFDSPLICRGKEYIAALQNSKCLC